MTTRPQSEPLSALTAGGRSTRRSRSRLDGGADPRSRPQARPLRRRGMELRPEGLGRHALKWCFAYPDLYEIGMSNLGLRILYEVLNDRPDRLAERCFAPDVDLQAELRAASVPLWSLETRRPLREFDVIGLSLGFELV
jgi:hypothetical protein